jgi:hypothetical protein
MSRKRLEVSPQHMTNHVMHQRLPRALAHLRYLEVIYCNVTFLDFLALSGFVVGLDASVLASPPYARYAEEPI